MHLHQLCSAELAWVKTLFQQVEPNAFAISGTSFSRWQPDYECSSRQTVTAMLQVKKILALLS